MKMRMLSVAGRYWLICPGQWILGNFPIIKVDGNLSKYGSPKLSKKGSQQHQAQVSPHEDQEIFVLDGHVMNCPVRSVASRARTLACGKLRELDFPVR